MQTPVNYGCAKIRVTERLFCSRSAMCAHLLFFICITLCTRKHCYVHNYRTYKRYGDAGDTPNDGGHDAVVEMVGAEEISRGGVLLRWSLEHVAGRNELPVSRCVPANNATCTTMSSGDTTGWTCNQSWSRDGSCERCWTYSRSRQNCPVCA